MSTKKTIKKIRKYNSVIGAAWRNKEDIQAYKKMNWMERTKFNIDLTQSL